MIIAGSFVVLILSFFLFRLAAGSLSLTRPHLVSIIFYKDFILFSFFGVVFIATSFDLKNDLYWWGTTGHVHEQARLYGWLSTMYTMLSFPIGMILANVFLIRKFTSKNELKVWYEKSFEYLFSEKENAIFFSLCTFLIISFLSIIYVYASIRNFPLYHLIRGVDSSLLSVMRADAKVNFSGVAAIKNTLAINLTFFISLVCYGYKLMYKGGRFRLLFYFSAVLVFFSLTYNLEKAPFFIYLISLFFINVVYRKGISLGKAFLFFVPLLLMVFFVFGAITGADEHAEKFFFRVFIAQSVAIFQGFEYFPSAHEFLGFSGISRFFSAVNESELFQSGRVLFQLYSPDAIKNNTAGYIVGLFNAESWMLFGLLGLLIIPIYVGFFVQTLNLFFLKSKKTPIYIALYVYFWTKLSLSGSVAQFLYPIMFLSIFILFFCVISFAKLIRTNK